MPKSITPTRQAKRGDLVVIERAHKDYCAGEGIVEYSLLKLGIVRSVTREGMVKAADVPFTTEASLLTKIDTYHTCYIVPAQSVDVPAVMEAYKHHTYDGDTQVQPFNDLDDVREFVRPFLKSCERGQVA